MRNFILFVLLSLSYVLYGQIPAHYYDDAYNKSGYELKTSLSKITKDGHTTNTYQSLWTHFRTTDARDDGAVWDMYSDCTFVFGSKPSGDQCGNYSNICDCYNREHSFPKSWFGGDDKHYMYADLFHLYPTDGKVNAIRADYPFGETGGAQYNISKLGGCTFDGYTKVVFEPADEYKGDFARTYFYVATRYENEIAGWKGCDMLAGNGSSVFTEWTINLLLKWHLQDPVSEKEINRNNEVYKIQKNRNPFIDYPELAELIWGAEFGEPFTPNVSIEEKETAENHVSISPNPSSWHVTVAFEQPFSGVMYLYNTWGVCLQQIILPDASSQELDISNYPGGLYILRLATDNQPPVHKKIIKY